MITTDGGGPVRRVLMTADTVGGVWTYALDLAAGLASHDIEVKLATMGPRPSREQRRDALSVPGLELFESSFALEWMNDPWADVDRASDWLLRLEGRVAPDVLHLNGFCHGALAFRAPALVVAHSCVLSWWRAVRGGDAPASYDRYRVEVAAGLAGASGVVAVSSGMLQALERCHGRCRDAKVIHNGRDARPFRPARTKEPFVFSSGRLWDPAKNVAALGAVAGRVKWPIVVAGSDERPDGSRETVPGVHALGRLDSAAHARWLARAAIFALPARYEPFGLGPLEAALAGCALVLGDIPSLREVWADAAVYVAPGDLAGLEAALRRLIEDDVLRRRMSVRARSRAHCFTVARMTDGYLALYRTLDARARGKVCA